MTTTTDDEARLRLKNEMADAAAIYLRKLVRQMRIMGCPLSTIVSGMNAELILISVSNFGGAAAATMCEQAARLVRESPNLNPGSLEAMPAEGTA